MFNRIVKYKFLISGGIIFILGVCFLGAMLRFSGIDIPKHSKLPVLKQAKQYYLDGKYQPAASLYEKIIILDPGNSAAILDLAVIYDDYLNNDKKAVILYKRYLEIDSNTEKTSLIQQWIRDAAYESMGVTNTRLNPEMERIKKLEKDLESARGENHALEEEVEKLSGRLFTIQEDFEKEIQMLQWEKESMTSEISAGKIRVSEFTRQIAELESSREELIDEIEQLKEKQKYEVYRQK